MLKVRVLGSAAGGGFPQWNCHCPNCQLARQGSPFAPPRTQSSLAVSADGERWVLLNASPDIGQQIRDNEILHPKRDARHSPINAVVLTNADVDHVAGLLTLRERQRFSLYATQRVQGVLSSNRVFDVLNPEFVQRLTLASGVDEPLVDGVGESLGLVVHMFPIPGKVALYLEDEQAGENFGSVPEDTVGLFVRPEHSQTGFYYLPGCAAMPEDLAARIRGAELVFMDGTTWRDDEMAQTGVGQKTSQRMGHMFMSGDAGSIAAFETLDVKQKVFVHMNNTNPVLIRNSPEHEAAVAAGWVIAEDGMNFEIGAS